MSYTCVLFLAFSIRFTYEKLNFSWLQILMLKRFRLEFITQSMCWLNVFIGCLIAIFSSYIPLTTLIRSRNEVEKWIQIDTAQQNESIICILQMLTNIKFYISYTIKKMDKMIGSVWMIFKHIHRNAWEWNQIFFCVWWTRWIFHNLLFVQHKVVNQYVFLFQTNLCLIKLFPTKLFFIVKRKTYTFQNYFDEKKNTTQNLFICIHFTLSFVKLSEQRVTFSL